MHELLLQAAQVVVAGLPGGAVGQGHHNGAVVGQRQAVGRHLGVVGLVQLGIHGGVIGAGEGGVGNAEGIAVLLGEQAEQGPEGDAGHRQRRRCLEVRGVGGVEDL